MWRRGWLDETYIEVFLNEFFKSLLFKCWKRVYRVYRANWRLSAFFQINLKVIRIMRSKDFSFGFAENISKFMIIGRDIGEVRSLYKFCGVSLNIWQVKTEFKVTKAWKFWCAQEYCSTNNSDVRLLRDRHRGLRSKYGNCGIWWLQRNVRK